MLQVRLGRTGITVNKNGFGALPIQRVAMPEAVKILRRAYDAGIDYYDTARSYSDSEEKLGAALAGVRAHVYIATKTAALTPEGIRADLETSLRNLQTDYVDVLQLHTPPVCPLPNDGSGVYEELVQLRREGKIRFIGFTNHRLHVARQAVECGLYDTLQFPFNYLSGRQELELVQMCAANDLGFVCMKGLSGGLITNGALAYAWMARHPAALPIWGIQKMEELEQFIGCQEATPVLNDEMQRQIETDRAQLTGAFCRGCGYCMPCPQNINISFCARMSLMLRRAPSEHWLTPHWKGEMDKIVDCIECGQCKSRCPYDLDTPALLKSNYADYQSFLA